MREKRLPTKCCPVNAPVKPVVFTKPERFGSSELAARAGLISCLCSGAPNLLLLPLISGSVTGPCNYS